MADLIAQGPQNYHRWRREVPEPTSCTEIVIGRSDADWNVPWDPMISRAHIKLVPQPNQRVEITATGTARNPVFHQGRHAVRFVLVPGDHFVIGNTTFTLSTGQQQRSPVADGSGQVDVTENVFDHVALRRKHFHDVQSRIDVLTRLPDLIASSESDQELLVRVTSVLLQSTPTAEAVSILDASRFSEDPSSEIEVLHYDNRSATLRSSPVSRKLVRRAIETRESILNVWGSLAGGSQFTAREEVDWAFCVPLRTEACRGWVIYITGQLHDPEQDSGAATVSVSEQLQDDVKFAELVGSTVASLRQSRTLQRRQAAMRNFFSPLVMQAISGNEIGRVLEPREADLAVMFCDLRGFSDHSERHSSNLLQLLSDVSDALGVMTKHILGFDGVIGDFHGDAAMGFWGWPLEQTHAVASAIQAALAIRDEYHRSEHGFRCGIGIAYGRAVAGQIGTTDQVKVTSFGPVVNLASRLESMTKRFGAEIILDANAAEALKSCSDDTVNGPNYYLRRLANVRPAGFNAAVEIYQLGASSERNTELEQAYERAVNTLDAGRTSEAAEQLAAIANDDAPAKFLYERIMAGSASAEGIVDVPK